MKNRQLASFSVSAIGLGCMNLSHAYGAPVSAEQAERVLLTALDQGRFVWLWGQRNLGGQSLEAAPQSVHPGQQMWHARR
jgi:hypothetical protein